MRTLLDRISEAEAAIQSPSTWTDERKCLRGEVREYKASLKLAKDNAAVLLAIVKDLAYGAGTTFRDKVNNARRILNEAGLVDREEAELDAGRKFKLEDGGCFYDADKAFHRSHRHLREEGISAKYQDPNSAP